MAGGRPYRHAARHDGLALQVQEVLGRDPPAGDLFVFRDRSGDMIKIIWPSPADGVVAISAAQLAYMLDGIDWRHPRHTFRPQSAG